MQKSHVDIIMSLCWPNENHCGKKKKKKLKKKKIVVVKNNIVIRIAGKVSRYIDASMNRATPNKNEVSLVYVFGEKNETILIITLLQQLEKNNTLR